MNFQFNPIALLHQEIKEELKIRTKTRQALPIKLMSYVTICFDI